MNVLWKPGVALVLISVAEKWDCLARYGVTLWALGAGTLLLPTFRLSFCGGRGCFFLVDRDFVDCQKFLLALRPCHTLGMFSSTQVMSGHLYL